MLAKTKQYFINIIQASILGLSNLDFISQRDVKDINILLLSRLSEHERNKNGKTLL